MNVTPEILAKARTYLKVKISEPVLRLLLEKIPNEEIMPTSLSVMEDLIKDAPSGTPEQTVQYVMQKAQKLSQNRKDEAPGNSRKYTRELYDSIWLEQRLMDAKMPDTSMELFGETFASPIMTAALSHLRLYTHAQENPMIAMAQAARLANTVSWLGMSEDEEFDTLVATGARIVRVIKPYADEEKLLRQIRHTEEMGALAVGVDIDHVFTAEGKLDVVRGEELAIKSRQQLAGYGDLMEDLRRKAEAKGEKLPLNIRLMKFMKDKKWSVYMSWSEDTFIELFYIPSAKKKHIPNSGKDLNYTHYALVVSDLQEFRQQVIDRGGAAYLDAEITMGLEHTWQMWMHDPDGNPFEVMQYTPQSYQITGR